MFLPLFAFFLLSQIFPLLQRRRNYLIDAFKALPNVFEGIQLNEGPLYRFVKSREDYNCELSSSSNIGIEIFN